MTETCTTEQVPNPEYIPPFEGYWATVENPDYVPAVPETTVFDGYMKWNWTGGPLNYVPAAPGGTDDWGWHQVGITNDSKGGTPDVVHQGNGKASFFYYEIVYTVTPAIPEQGSPTIDIWVEGSPAVGEEFLIEVTCEEPPILNPPVFQWVTGEPVIDCEGMTVTVVSHEEAAGWYWGNDGEQYLGGFFPTATEPKTTTREVTLEECPAPVVQPPPAEEEPPAVDPPATSEEEPDPDPAPGDEETPPGAEEPEEVPGEIDCPEGTVPGWLDENGDPQGCVNNQPIPGKPDTPVEPEEAPSETPEQPPATQAEVAQPVTPAAEGLAVTGAGLEWTALIIGAVFVMAGLALYLKRPKR